jgi:hypothetical protein
MLCRTQIQLEVDMYQNIRKMAYRQGKSMSAVVRELLDAAIKLQAKPAKRKKRLTVGEIKFIGIASEPYPDNISERHDEILGEIEW